MYSFFIRFLTIIPICLSNTFFFFNDTATTEIYTLSLHDALPISIRVTVLRCPRPGSRCRIGPFSNSCSRRARCGIRSEEHTSELQSHLNLVCRLLLEKKKTKTPLTYLYPYISRITHDSTSDSTFF